VYQTELAQKSVGSEGYKVQTTQLCSPARERSSSHLRLIWGHQSPSAH